MPPEAKSGGRTVGRMITTANSGRQGESLKMLQREEANKMFAGLAVQYKEIVDEAFEDHRKTHPGATIETFLADTGANNALDEKLKNHQVELKFEDGTKQKTNLYKLAPKLSELFPE